MNSTVWVTTGFRNETRMYLSFKEKGFLKFKSLKNYKK